MFSSLYKVAYYSWLPLDFKNASVWTYYINVGVIYDHS